MLEEPRTVRVTRMGRGAIVVDVVGEGRENDQLPSQRQLRAWLDGVQLGSSQRIPKERPLIVVDAGHGGWDHGAVGVTGTREADVALQIARRVVDKMGEDLDVDILMTREDDEFISLQQRSLMANQADADLFLSIHANAALNQFHRGIETYSMNTASDEGAARVARRENVLAFTADGENDFLRGRMMSDGTNRLSRDLAHDVQARMIQSLKQEYGDEAVRDLGTKTALFYVLVSTRMPAILVETSFVSNPQEERQLRCAHFQDALAQAIVDAVGDWLKDQQ
ncbi:MAG: N-acetylmuramoyl-L-alanine amidase [Myxococcota bacterium]